MLYLLLFDHTLILTFIFPLGFFLSIGFCPNWKLHKADVFHKNIDNYSIYLNSENDPIQR